MALNVFLTCFIIAICSGFTNSAAINDQELEIGHYNFALNLNKQLYKSSGTNKDYVLHSPVNIYAATAVVAYGAGGQTKDQLISLLGLPVSNNWEELHKSLASKFVIAQTNQKANITISEGIFVQDGFQLKEPFKKFVEETYKGKIVNVDFAKNGQKTLDTINSWVSENTGGRIKEISSEPYDPSTLAVLANALYFHAHWQKKFKKSNTYTLDFNAYGQKTPVKFMTDTSYIQYYEDIEGKFRSVGIPYDNDEFSIYIVLPNEDTTLEAVVEKFNIDHIQKVINAGTQLIDFKIPQAELEFKASLEDHLCALGVHDLFTEKANLENIAAGIKVSKVTHKVELKINEEGTIGSAVTTYEIVPLSGTSFYPPPKTFFVNRPYLFFIHQKSTKFIIFQGSVNKPAPIKSET